MSDSETTRQRTFAGLLQRGSWPERFDELADTHGVPYAQRYFIEGAPLRVIQSLVPTLKIDVVVVGVVQPRRWAKLIGDTTERFVNHASCSILRVRLTSAD
ncbi:MULTISPECIES: universal stress protein [Pseudomonas]|uniref:UspA domain-containing protein n=2 Tax=Pseudomonas TaxID=286 RepID=A0A2R7UNT4_PSEDL|nr:MULTISPECIES: universal stress protein [Pseudomonas]MBF8646527.1 universal stress protein [Pseudomonas pudica]MBF8761911.1 universal stress protein [Pseudomonas pudica]MRF41193.1 hypothetical protein [Escherichia coli]PTU53788.1 hypothetical protein DBB42_02600 [Pseudomonas plecoglossicida]